MHLVTEPETNPKEIRSVENISGVSAHRRENLEKLNQSLIGKNITDHAQNSKQIQRRQRLY